MTLHVPHRRWISAVFAVQMLSTTFVLAQLAPTPGEIQRSEDATLLAPGVLIAPGRQEAYVMAPNDAVNALDLTTGFALWSSQAGAKPLGLYGNLLAVQPTGGSDTLEVAFLDVLRPAAPPAFEIPLALPDGVRASVDERLGHSFNASLVTRSGGPELEWQHRATWRGGARPPAGVTPVNLTSERYVLDLANASFTAAPAARSNAQLPAAALSFADDLAVSTPPAQRGTVVSATAITDGRRGLLLKRWDAQTGTALADVELVSDRYILDLASADGSHILVSQRTGTRDQEYTWSIVAADTGSTLGEIRAADSHAPFVVAGSTLLFVTNPRITRQNGELIAQPPTLKAHDLSSGTLLWQHEIRDTRFYGEVPP